MTASEPTPPIASPSPAAPLASQLAANPCSHPSFDQFVATIAALRAPDGCPWDRTQTHQSIAHNMIEEAYEAVDAIEAADVAHLREELGDVLLQVVFHSDIAAANPQGFDIVQVVEGLVQKLRSRHPDVNEKMVRRHPHVFGEAQAANAGDVLDLWERVKMAEKGAADEAADGAGERREGLLDGVPTSFPALMQAQKISRKAAAAGFEWDSLDGVWEKVREEIAELQEAYAVAPKAANGKVDAAAASAGAAVDPAAAEAAVAAVEDELGDVLFSLVNVGRRMGVDAEGALRSTCRKFRDRWAWMEQAAWQQGRTIEDLSSEERETLWNEAKKRERS